MKREGRQHGMVRSSVILPVELNARPNAKAVNCLNSPPTAGELTKVSLKPTNHSKYTGKCRKARCRECHAWPVSKSKDKAKGTYKLKSSDVTLNHQLVSCKVVAGGSLLSFKGTSATEVLGYLSASACYEEDDQYDDQKRDDNIECSFLYSSCLELVADDIEDEKTELSSFNDSEKDSDEEDENDFCVVGMAFEHSDIAEDWLVVEDM